MLKWVQVAVSEGHPIRVAGRVSSPHAQSVIALLARRPRPADDRGGRASAVEARLDVSDVGGRARARRRNSRPARARGVDDIAETVRDALPVGDAPRPRARDGSAPARRSGTPRASPSAGRRRRRGDAALHRVGVLVARSDCADHRVDRGRRGSVVGAGRRRSCRRRTGRRDRRLGPCAGRPDDGGRRWPAAVHAAVLALARAGRPAQPRGARPPRVDPPAIADLAATRQRWNTASQSNDERPRQVSIRRSSSNCERDPGLRVLTVYLAWNYLRPGLERYVASYVDPQRTLISTSAQPLFREAGRS